MSSNPNFTASLMPSFPYVANPFMIAANAAAERYKDLGPLKDAAVKGNTVD